MLDWPLLSGALPRVVQIAGALAATWLLVRIVLAPHRAVTKVIACFAYIAVALTVTVVGDELARNVCLLFPDRIPAAALLRAGVAVFTLCMAASLAATADRWPVSAMVLVACAHQVNAVFGAYPTPRDAFGISRPDEVPLPALPSHVLAPSTRLNLINPA